MKELKSAVVTGATSGIGEATVRTLVKSGRKVLAMARREDRLNALADELGVEILPSDVRELEGAIDTIQKFAPDILVNNAGVGHGVEGLDNLTGDLVQESVDINVAAPINLTAAVLPGMRSRERGHIVNIGSIAGLHTLRSALYGATKSAIHIFSQNLRVEVAGTGIRVTEVCPGRTATEFYQSAQGNREAIERMGQSGIRELVPDDVANAILFAIETPSHVNVATIEMLPTDQAVGGLPLAKRSDRN